MVVSTTAWILQQLKAAEKEWTTMDQESREERTLRPDEGRAQEEARLLTR